MRARVFPGEGAGRLPVVLLLVLTFSCTSGYETGSRGGGYDDAEDMDAFREEHRRRMAELGREHELARSGRAATPAGSAGADAEDALAKLPVRLIRVEMVRSAADVRTSRSKGAGAFYQGKNIRAGSPAPPGPGYGATARLRGDDWRATAFAGQSAETDLSNTTSFLVVMDGGEGLLNIGTEGTGVRRVPLGGGKEAVVLGNPTSGHRLAVRARIVGTGMIEIRAWPVWMSGDRRTGMQRYEELGTSVVVRSGQPFTIGGLDTSGRGGRQRLFARSESARGGGSSVVLCATILGSSR